MSQQAQELFENFDQLTPSEFFRKNKQMLGFSGKIRSLTIVFHELITNSFDAAEEAGILPEIRIDLKQLGKEHYLLRHSDNGPGISSDDNGEPHIALNNIRERLSLINGTLTISSNEFGGTTIQLFIPNGNSN